MLSITSFIDILIASSFMGLMYFFIDFDWKYWVYVGIYTAFYTVGMFIGLFIEIMLIPEWYIDVFMSELVLSYQLSIILNIIFYVLIGMGVVYILRTMKGSEKKLFMAVGIITQVVLTIFAQQLIGVIVG